MGGKKEFRKFLNSCSYEYWHVLHVPDEVNFHLHSGEPLG